MCVCVCTHIHYIWRTKILFLLANVETCLHSGAICAGLHTFKGLFDGEALALMLKSELAIMFVKVPTKIEVRVCVCGSYTVKLTLE